MERQIRGLVPSHDARVLEVRIHLPPPVSLRTLVPEEGYPSGSLDAGYRPSVVPLTTISIASSRTGYGQAFLRRIEQPSRRGLAAETIRRNCSFPALCPFQVVGPTVEHNDVLTLLPWCGVRADRRSPMRIDSGGVELFDFAAVGARQPTSHARVLEVRIQSRA